MKRDTVLDVLKRSKQFMSEVTKRDWHFYLDGNPFMETPKKPANS